MKQRRFFILLLILLCCYLGGYCWFRATHIEVGARNGSKPYVIFLANTIPLYYLFRPLMYADGALTGMGFHLGPHRETQ